MRRCVWLLVSFALLGGACSGAPGRAPDATGSERAPSPAPSGTGSTGGGSTPGSPAASGRPSRSADPDTTPPTPAPGAYTYDVVETTEEATGPSTRKYPQRAEIDPPVATTHGPSVELRFTADHTEEVSGEVHLYHRGGIDMLFADGCALGRRAVLYRFPIEVGDSYASPRMCEGRSDTATTRVLRQQTLTIGGERVACFVIERKARLGDDTSTKVQWFSPRYALVVRSELSETIGGSDHTVDQVLRSLSPA